MSPAPERYKHPCACAFAVFARYPLPGKVKTRLALECGDDIAARIYALCAEYTFNQLKKTAFAGDSYLFIDDRERISQAGDWAGQEFICTAQEGAELGQRMENAFQYLFSAGAKKVCLLFTDAPDLTAGIMEDAREALDACEAVLGPSTDGGHYLLGLKQPLPGLFGSIPWGKPQSAALAIDYLHRKGLSVAVLPRLIDIDTIDDLRLWLEHLPHASQHPLEEFIYRIGLIKGDRL